MAFDFFAKNRIKKDLGYKTFEDHVEVYRFHNHKNNKITLGSTGFLLAERYHGVFSLPERIANKPVTVIGGTYDSNGFINSLGPYFGFGGENLCQIILPDTITKLGDGVFAHCKNLTKIVIPPKVSSIGEYAFALCESLTTISIPSSVESVGKCCFHSCRSLSSLQLKEGLKIIKSLAFSNCEKLETLVIPDSVIKIEDYAFQSCSSLQSVVLPKSCLEMDGFVFEFCNVLERVTIPKTVARISVDAFRNSPIKEVFFDGTESEWNSFIERNGNIFSTKVTMHYNS